MLAAVLLFHGLDDHSRMLDASGRRAPETSADLFIANLEDTMMGLLLAPVSAEARAGADGVQSIGRTRRQRSGG